MTEPQFATCAQCLRKIAPHDTVVVRSGVPGHLDCRRPRVLSAEELTACALPSAVRRRAQQARDAARRLVKQSQQLRLDLDLLIREAEAARAPARGATTENKDGQ